MKIKLEMVVRVLRLSSLDAERQQRGSQFLYLEADARAELFNQLQVGLDLFGRKVGSESGGCAFQNLMISHVFDWRAS